MTHPPAAVTQLFPEWRSPRRGSINPHEMTNDVWRWLINHRLSAYQANQLFNGPSPFNAGPGWCFDRFGQTETLLPNGSSLLVAGEHEDHYDPDFYIYNDVVIIDQSGEISIFGYPTEVFPPTDFHTATLLGNSLILIGNLGYSQNRRADQTQVLKLELDTWRISKIDTHGYAPGWIHAHTAILAATGTEILVTGGKIDRCDDTVGLVENIDDWSLDLSIWRWQRITQRPWIRFQIYRADKNRNCIWGLRHLSWSRSVGWDNLKDQEDQLIKALGDLPDPSLLEALYTPKIATEILGEDPEQYSTFRIRVGEVVVRYVEGSFEIQMTAEGVLPQNILDELQKDIVEKLTALEQSEITCVLVPPQ